MTTTYLSNVLSTKSSFKNPFELLFGEKPILHDKLTIFGEVGVVTTKDKIQAKLTNRGTSCIFVGYSENHSRNVYRMLNLEANSVINSRDIIWLKKMHKDWLKNKLMTITEEDVVELPIGNERNKVEEAVPNVDENAKKNENERVIREMKRLESWFNPQATKFIEEYDCGREISLEQVNLALFTTVFIKEPSSFEVAINCEKREYQDALKEAIDKELSDISKRGV
jgi:hypothetical protein